MKPPTASEAARVLEDGQRLREARETGPSWSDLKAELPSFEMGSNGRSARITDRRDLERYVAMSQERRAREIDLSRERNARVMTATLSDGVAYPEHVAERVARRRGLVPANRWGRRRRRIPLGSADPDAPLRTAAEIRGWG